MAKLKLLLLVCLTLCVLLISLAFIMRNDGAIAVDFFFFQLDQISVGIWILLSFVLGGLLGIVVRLPGAIWSASRYKAQNQKLARQSKRLKQLEQEPAKVA